MLVFGNKVNTAFYNRYRLPTVILNRKTMDTYDYNDVKAAVISAVVVLNIIMNSLVIALLARYPALRQDRTALFVFSLCLSDLASGCTAMPIAAAVCSSATPIVRLRPGLLPKIQMFCYWWFAFNSLHSLSWVAVSKLIAITKPLYSEQLLTRSRCYGIIVFNWIVGAVLAASKISTYGSWNTSICLARSPVNNKYASMLILATYIVTVVVPDVVLIVATIMTLVVVVRAHRQISTQVQSIGGLGAPFNPGLVTVQAIRSARNIIIICFVSMLLTFPIITFAISRHAIDNDTISIDMFGFSAISIYHLNSVMNSFLYLILYRSVRQKFMDMFANIRHFCFCLEHNCGN